MSHHAKLTVKPARIVEINKVSTLLVEAHGPRSISYEWSRDGEVVEGNKSNIVTSPEDGDYVCRVLDDQHEGVTEVITIQGGKIQNEVASTVVNPRIK